MESLALQLAVIATVLSVAGWSMLSWCESEVNRRVDHLHRLGMSKQDEAVIDKLFVPSFDALTRTQSHKEDAERRVAALEAKEAAA